MPTILTQSTPLTTEEQNLLHDIYKTRLRYMIGFLSGAYMLIMQVNIGRIIKPFVSSSFADSIADYAVIFCWLLVTTIFFGWIFYKRVNPFRKDYKQGVKVTVIYTIVRKTYFPYTNQYFIELNDPDYMHHEVDEAFYNNCSDGDTAYLYMAPCSKYIFEKNGRFTII